MPGCGSPADEVVFSYGRGAQARNSPAAGRRAWRSALLDLAQARSRPGDHAARHAAAAGCTRRWSRSGGGSATGSSTARPGRLSPRRCATGAGRCCGWRVEVADAQSWPICRGRRSMLPGADLRWRCIRASSCTGPSRSGDAGGGRGAGARCASSRSSRAPTPAAGSCSTTRPSWPHPRRGRPERRREGAYVRMLNWGSRRGDPRRAGAGAVPRAARLVPRQSPGGLVLETEHRRRRPGDARAVRRRRARPGRARAARGPGRLLDRARHDRRRRPCPASPATCCTRRPGRARDDRPVTDRYATDLCATLYGELARATRAGAAGRARRRCAAAWRRPARASPDPNPWAEWATPALFQAGPALPLYTAHRSTAPRLLRPASSSAA